jgi:hypothetical protein
MSKVLKIECCTQCPNHSTERDYTADSWEYCVKWNCKKLKNPVRRYVDWNDHDKYIPKNCPLEDKK